MPAGSARSDTPADVPAEVHGYRGSQKVLHWLTVLAVAAQFAVGYTLDLDEEDCDPPGEELGGGDTADELEDRLDRLEDACGARADDSWLPLHVGAHVAFFVALAPHLFTNLRPAILRRML